MRVAENVRLENSDLKVERYDKLITLSYAIFSIAFLVIIYVASQSAGTASGEFASISAFP